MTAKMHEHKHDHEYKIVFMCLFIDFVSYRLKLLNICLINFDFLLLYYYCHIILDLSSYYVP